MDALQEKSQVNRIIRFCLENKIVVVLGVLLIIVWGVMVAPFDWEIPYLPRDPVPVDAIPDIGENQQIVFTEWMGRSPQDIEDQITYPLTTSLLGIVKGDPCIGPRAVHCLEGFAAHAVRVQVDQRQ